MWQSHKKVLCKYAHSFLKTRFFQRTEIKMVSSNKSGLAYTKSEYLYTKLFLRDLSTDGNQQWPLLWTLVETFVCKMYYFTFISFHIKLWIYWNPISRDLVIIKLVYLTFKIRPPLFKDSFKFWMMKSLI